MIKPENKQHCHQSSTIKSERLVERFLAQKSKLMIKMQE